MVLSHGSIRPPADLSVLGQIFTHIQFKGIALGAAWCAGWCLAAVFGNSLGRRSVSRDRRRAQGLHCNSTEGGSGKQTVEVEQGAAASGGAARPIPPPAWEEDVYALVERVLARHGLLPRTPAAAHRHTMSCYDGGGKLICGGAQ